MSKSPHITLNFSQVFIDRLKAYAVENDMKINAVVKQAFKLLEDHPELVVRKGRFDYE